MLESLGSVSSTKSSQIKNQGSCWGLKASHLISSLTGLEFLPEENEMGCDPLCWILGQGPLLPRSSKTWVLATNLGIFLNVELRVQLLAAGLQIAQIKKSCLFLHPVTLYCLYHGPDICGPCNADYHPITVPRCLSDASLLFFLHVCTARCMYIFMWVCARVHTWM